MLKIVVAVVALACAAIFLFSLLPSCESMGLAASQANPLECSTPK